ncbi:MAG: hypothetical protein H6839_16840 [Planctomycetes bacterium]|nr:hypothetical protein [Planctomycetota bacterium]
MKLEIRTEAYVALESTRLEVTLKGHAMQAVNKWSGSMTAWDIDGDDTIPTIIKQSDGTDATWEVK